MEFNLYEYTKKLDTKIGKKVFKALDENRLSIAIYKGAFYFEKTERCNNTRDWIIKVMEKHGIPYAFSSKKIWLLKNSSWQSNI